MSADPANIAALVGSMDIYLLDQVLRGRIPSGARILDVGCGGGRNLEYFVRCGHPVAALDADSASVAALRERWIAIFDREILNTILFLDEAIEETSLPDAWADVVVCNAVLHFARDESHFLRMVEGCWKALGPGGMLFARLASTIGMGPDRLRSLGNGWFELPDGSERFLVDEETLLRVTTDLGGKFLDPLKTTVVANARCMTTWVIGK